MTHDKCNPPVIDAHEVSDSHIGIMKTLTPLLAALTLPLVAQTLPEATLKPFAAVPPPITGIAGPLKPMEAKAPELKDCANAPAIFKKLGIALTPEQTAWLQQHRFLLIPLEHTSLGENPPADADDEEWAHTSDEMLQTFNSLAWNAIEDRSPDETKLVTPDLVLHAWHRSFQRTLEYCEERRLHQLLETFLSGMRRNLQNMRKTVNAGNATAVAQAEARIALAWVLLGKAHNPDADGSDPGAEKLTATTGYENDVRSRLTVARAGLPAAVAEALEKELTLILAHEGMQPSPLFASLHPDRPQDYTQYKTRSHYTKNNVLGGYFRTMMQLGRNGYPLDSDEGLRDALILAQAMATPDAKGVTPVSQWQQVMEITSFFAGESDDITYTQLREWIQLTTQQAVLGKDKIFSADYRKKLLENLAKLPPPRINSRVNANQPTAELPVEPEFRLFGQRFTWDTHVMQQWVVGAPAAMPSLPTAAYIPAAFGDPFATARSLEHVQSYADQASAYSTEFQQRLPKIRAEISAVGDAAWFASLGSKQLHVIGQLAGARNANYPFYMQGEAFAAKNFTSMLGSYTQLKHDTVLYAKQLYAEGGEGGDSDGKLPPAPKGFVQPDLPFWREMERMSGFAAAGFAKHKLIRDAAEDFSRYQRFAGEMKFLRKLAEKLATQATVTTAEWETLRTLDLNYMASPILSQDIPKPGEGKNALVTDIATDVAGDKILMEALGRPYIMLAVVGGIHGTRLTAGVAYNHSEFTRSLTQGRMNDEEWQKDFYTNQPKQLTKPAWHPPVTIPVRLKEEKDE